MRPSFTKQTATAVAIAAFCLIHFTSMAQGQAPSSIAGDSIFVQETGSNYGYWMFSAADATNTFTNYVINNSSLDAFGTFFYDVSDTNQPLVIFQILRSEDNGTLRMIFTDAVSGMLAGGSTPSNDFESGNFFLATGTAPASVSGMTINCTVSNGLFPFSSNGTFTLTTGASNTYTITVDNYPLGNSQGTFSLNPINRSTAALSLTDSLIGSVTMYIGFSDSFSGMYAITQSNGGFQVGTFRAPQMPFFTDEVDLGGDWYWLSEGTNHVFGYYNMGYFPYVFHLDMGFEYFVDAGNTSHGAFLYDFSDGAWVYTEPGMFPYMFDYALGHWIWYCPLSGTTDHYTSNPRWFYDFTAQTWLNHLSPTVF